MKIDKESEVDNMGVITKEEVSPIPEVETISSEGEKEATTEDEHIMII